MGDFKRNRGGITNKLKNSYPTPNNLTAYEKQFIIIWGKDSVPLLSYLRSKLNNHNNINEYLELYNETLNNAINKYDNIKINSILQ